MQVKQSEFTVPQAEADAAQLNLQEVRAVLSAALKDIEKLLQGSWRVPEDDPVLTAITERIQAVTGLVDWDDDMQLLLQNWQLSEAPEPVVPEPEPEPEPED